MVTSTTRTMFSSKRPAVIAMYVGLVLTLAAAIVPMYYGQKKLTTYLRWVYEDSPNPIQIDDARTFVLSYMFIIAGLGVVAWLGLIWAVRRHKRWARVVATLVFLTASTISLTNLFIEEYGRPFLPLQFGVAGLLPCLAGLVAVIFLWTRSRDVHAR